MKYVKVPEKKVDYFNNVVIEKIIEKTEATITIDKQDNLIKVQHHNSLNEMNIAEAIESVSMGFDIDVAMKLVEDNMTIFETINIKKQTRNDKEFRRQKARIIGKNGKCKRVISQLADVNIQISGKKVGIIGDTSDVMTSRKSIMNIVRGKPHSYVYEKLETYNKNKRKNWI